MTNKLTEEECKEAMKQICELCHEEHKLRYGREALGCAFQSFDNDYCDKVKIFNYLINEHFELVKAYEKLEQSSYQLECAYNDLKEKAKALSDFNDELMRKLFFIEPYKFEELNKGMWVWDDKAKWIYIIKKINSKNSIEVDNGNLTYCSLVFEENRFYPLSKAKEG